MSTKALPFMLTFFEKSLFRNDDKKLSLPEIDICSFISSKFIERNSSEGSFDSNNEAFEIPKLDQPGLGPDELIELRIKLLTEEVQEYAEAARAGDLVEVLDALADIGYILAGTIINHGMQDIYDDAFNEVHRSNMAKLVDGKVLRREDGKVLKPDGWQPPQLAQFLQ